jgi:hypothetical protein
LTVCRDGVSAQMENGGERDVESGQRGHQSQFHSIAAFARVGVAVVRIASGELNTKSLSKDHEMQDPSTSIMKMRRAITAIAQAGETTSFAEIIASDLDSFKGLRVAYATKAVGLEIQNIRLDQIEAACPMVRSFFDGRGLLFYTDEIYRKTLEGGAAFHFDFSVSLDKNVAEAFRCFAARKGYSKPEEFYQLMLLLKGRGEHSFNFDYFSYLIEEMEHFDVPNNRRPLETLTALKRFDHLAPDALRSPPGSPEFLMSQSEGEAVARAALDGVIKTLSALELQVEHRGIYAILLKAMHLRWQKPARLSGRDCSIQP